MTVKYRLAEPASVDLDDGRVVASFSSGEVTPKNSQETQALEHLADMGLATRVKSKED